MAPVVVQGDEKGKELVSQAQTIVETVLGGRVRWQCMVVLGILWRYRTEKMTK